MGPGLSRIAGNLNAIGINNEIVEVGKGTLPVRLSLNLAHRCSLRPKNEIDHFTIPTRDTNPVVRYQENSD